MTAWAEGGSAGGVPSGGGGLIVPENIPFVGCHPTTIDGVGSVLTVAGKALPDAGAEVVSAWNGLGVSYTAPGSEELLAVMAPVAAVADDVGDGLKRVGKIVDTFAANLVKPVKELRDLQTEAEKFVAEVKDGVSVDMFNPDHPAYDDGQVQVAA
ncbi:MAG: hypothetical protein ACRCSP_03415, partial [Rhodoglobus sp.]